MANSPIHSPPLPPSPGGWFIPRLTFGWSEHIEWREDVPPEDELWLEARPLPSQVSHRSAWLLLRCLFRFCSYYWCVCVCVCGWGLQGHHLLYLPMNTITIAVGSFRIYKQWNTSPTYTSSLMSNMTTKRLSLLFSRLFYPCLASRQLEKCHWYTYVRLSLMH